jgi:xanthine dehydrogenase accessory factor
VNPELLERLRELRARRVPAALLTRLEDGAQALIDSAGIAGSLPLDAATAKEARRRMLRDESGMLADRIFVRVYSPPRRLLIVGAVHVAQELAVLAPVAGLSTTVIDPRTAFATAERFPSAALLAEWPEQALPRLAPDRRSAVVALSHDPKIDDPALLNAVCSEAFYIGALGSRKTHAARRERLAAAGATPVQLDRIHAPVGLPLGGRSPGEIAIAIVAQAVQCFYAAAP